MRSWVICCEPRSRRARCAPMGVHEVKALLVGCQAMQSYNKDVSRQVTDVVFDGLRPRP